MTEPLRVVIADDDEQVRTQVKKLVEGQTHMTIVADAATGRDAIMRVKEQVPDLLLLDLEMPEMTGLQVLQRIRRVHPHMPVVIVSGRTDRASVHAVQELGAQGYVAKRDLDEELMLAIETVMAGGSFLSRAVSHKRTVSTQTAHGPRATARREATMTHDQDHDTAVLPTSTVSSEPDHASRHKTGLIRVLVVDDESLVVRVLYDILTKEGQMHLVGSCGDVDTAVRLIEQQSPDIVLLDLGLPSSEPVRSLERGGWYLVDQVRRADARVRVILCTRTAKRKDVTEAWRKGIDGYVPKTVIDEELVQAIYTVHSGERYFSGSLGKFGLKCRGLLANLTEAEQKIFFLFVRGLTTEQIMGELCVGEGAIDSHKHHIREKIGHQYGWKGVANEVRKEEKARAAKKIQKANDTPKYSAVLSGLTEMERKVFDRYVGRWDGRCYVGGMTLPENMTEGLRIPVGEVKAILLEIRHKLPCHPDGWTGIAKEEGDID